MRSQTATRIRSLAVMRSLRVTRMRLRMVPTATRTKKATMTASVTAVG